MSEPHPARTTTISDWGLSLALLAFVWSAVFYILKAPFGHIVWLSALVLVVRYGLLTFAALCLRPWPMKLIVAPSVLLWGLLDLLATMGWFDVYALLRPAEDFIYFQF